MHDVQTAKMLLASMALCALAAYGLAVHRLGKPLSLKPGHPLPIPLSFSVGLIGAVGAAWSAIDLFAG